MSTALPPGGHEVSPMTRRTPACLELQLLVLPLPAAQGPIQGMRLDHEPLDLILERADLAHEV